MARLCGALHVRYATEDVTALRCSLDGGWSPEPTLTARERQLYARCRIPKRRAEWLGGQRAARQAAAALLSRRPNEVEVDRRASGAPFVVAHAGVHVSISHSGGVAVAVAAPVAVGVDIERNEPRHPALLRVFLCENERRVVEGRAQEERTDELNRLWSCKEAASKVGGWGGAKAFRNIDCSVDPISIDGISIHHASARAASYVLTIAYAAGAQHG